VQPWAMLDRFAIGSLLNPYLPDKLGLILRHQ
jgi:hypothetical protein